MLIIDAILSSKHQLDRSVVREIRYVHNLAEYIAEEVCALYTSITSSSTLLKCTDWNLFWSDAALWPSPFWLDPLILPHSSFISLRPQISTTNNLSTLRRERQCFTQFVAWTTTYSTTSRTLRILIVIYEFSKRYMIMTGFNVDMGCLVS